MPFIMPTSDQFKQLMSRNYKGPIVMVNLHGFNSMQLAASCHSGESRNPGIKEV